MNKAKLKLAALRLAKVAGAAALAAAIGFLSGPEAVGIIGTQYAVIVTVLLIPALSAVEKVLTAKP